MPRRKLTEAERIESAKKAKIRALEYAKKYYKKNFADPEFKKRYNEYHKLYNRAQNAFRQEVERLGWITYN